MIRVISLTNPKNWEHITCKLCGKDNFGPYHSGRTRFSLTPTDLDKVGSKGTYKCMYCGQSFEDWSYMTRDVFRDMRRNKNG